MSCINAAATVAPTIPNDSIVYTINGMQGANCRTFPNSRTSLHDGSGAAVRGEAGDPLHQVKDSNAVEDDNFVMFEDNALSNDGHAGNQDASKETEDKEEGPDLGVLDLCFELFKL
ncbi:hypothetical protein MHU86_25570 [Fragilaria crotonensis]|nr:hypothetical protein MHU86_25570 [Fragilaria crotonensis]